VGAAELTERLAPQAIDDIPVGHYVPLLEFNLNTIKYILMLNRGEDWRGTEDASSQPGAGGPLSWLASLAISRHHSSLISGNCESFTPLGSRDQTPDGWYFWLAPPPLQERPEAGRVHDNQEHCGSTKALYLARMGDYVFRILMASAFS
jgi:hypothetical protein